MTISLQELKENYSGATAPASPEVGQLWDDTSVTPSVLRKYNGTSWASVARTGSADNYADFQARAEMIRKVTPSGFSKPGKYEHGFSWVNKLSDLEGLHSSVSITNSLIIGDSRLDSVGLSENSEIVINGVILKYIKGDANIGDLFSEMLPAPPASGSRQDLVFLESWKEEVSKSDGLFFAYGNTQYKSSVAVDGATLTDTPAAHTGAEYFSASSGVYAVEAVSAPAEFINNPDHNIGVLENGNFFQVRYRLRIAADIDAINLTAANTSAPWRDSSAQWLSPQGQLASAPANGSATSTTGIFIVQKGRYTSERMLDDQGVQVGGKYLDDNTLPTPISGLSLDGFTYAIPICAVHRRNTGVYSLENQNGTAFDNAWHVTLDTAQSIAPHGYGHMSVVSISGSTFKVLSAQTINGTIHCKFLRISGNDTPAGAATWTYTGGAQASNITIVGLDTGEIVEGGEPAISARPDSLWSDVIDRRDVLDLRHKVSLSGSFDEDELYQETFDLAKVGEFRQEWESLADFDNDGNGTSLTPSKIYGNVILESLGLGATVPDAGANTDITRRTKVNNGADLLINGAHSVYSDAETIEDLTIFLEDQADGSGSKIHCAEDPITSYNSVTHSLEIDLTALGNYSNNISLDSTLLKSHKPKIVWGLGAPVAGDLTRTNDYNWSFEISEFSRTYSHDSADSSNLNYNKITNMAVNTPAEYIEVTFADNHMARAQAIFDNQNGSITRFHCGGVFDTHVRITGISDQGGNTARFLFDSSDYLVGTTGSTSGVPSPICQIAPPATMPATGNNADYGYADVSANESVFATYKVHHKAGSSFLNQLPYGADASKPSDIFINGEDVGFRAEPELVEPSTKEVDTSVYVDPEILLGAETNGANSLHAPFILKEGGTYHMLATHDISGHWHIVRYSSPDMKAWTFHGEVSGLEVTGGNYANEDTNAPAVVKVGGTYHMVFSGIGNALVSGAGQNWALMHSTSTDLQNWTTPLLCNGAFGGGAHSHVHHGLIYDDADNRFKIVGAYDGGLSSLDSADGVNWANLEVIPTPYTVACGSLIKDGALYRAFVATSNGRYLSYVGSSPKVDEMVLVGDHAGCITNTYCHLFKDGSKYRLIGSFHDGTRFNIHQGVLALSQTSGSADSVTGVYSNSSPQVNMGLKSSDTLVMHYERTAYQHDSASAFTAKTLEIKDMFATTMGSARVAPRSFLAYNSWYFAHMSYDNPPVSPAEAYSKTGLKEFSFDHKLATEDFAWINPKELGFNGLKFRNFEYHTSSEPDSNFPLSANKKPLNSYPSFNARYYEGTQPYQTSGVIEGATISTLGIIKTTTGKHYMHLNFEHGSQAQRLLGYAMGVIVTPLEMVGRPLVK